MRNITIIIVFCLCCIESYTQSTDQTIKPSVDVAKLITPADVQVSHYTGRVNISLPIYTIVDGDITIPITLGYSGGGIKTTEEASKVGLGWSLDVGGAIHRSIRGIPDEYPRYGRYGEGRLPHCNFDDLISQVSNGLSGTYRSGDSDPNSFYHNFITEGWVDSEADAFTVFVMGKSGKYILHEKGKAILQTESDLGFNELFNIPHLPKVPKFIDLAGNIYDFNDSSYSNVEFARHSIREEQDMNIPISNPYYNENYYFDKFYYPTAFYLAKIITPTQKMAQFKYKEVNFRYEINGNYSTFKTGRPLIAPSKTTSKLEVTDTQHPNILATLLSLAGMNEKYTTSYAPMSMIKRISEILTPNYIVYFDCDENVFREDIMNNNRIDAIRVVNRETGKIIKHLKFDYEYFKTPNSVDGYYDEEIKEANLRLKLLGVREIGVEGGEITLYNFTYTNEPFFKEDYSVDMELPAKTSQAYDYWGYINNDHTPINRDANPFPCHIGIHLLAKNTSSTYTKISHPQRVLNGMLSTITYATKGITTLNWECNTYSFIANRPYSNAKPEPTYKTIKTNLFRGGADEPILIRSIDGSPESISMTINAENYYGDRSYSDESCSDGFFYNYDLSNISWDRTTQKDVWNNMALVYFIKSQDYEDRAQIQSLDDKRIVRYCVITKEMMGGEAGKKALEFTLTLPKGSYFAILKPGKLKPRTNGIVCPQANYLWDYEKLATYIPSHVSGKMFHVLLSYKVLEHNSQENKNFRYTGGVRIRSIKDSDGYKNIYKSFNYDWDNGMSSGVLVDTPKTMESYFLNSSYGQGNVFRFFSTDSSNENTQGSHIGYRKVTVTEGISSALNFKTLGTKVYHFTSPFEYQDMDEGRYNIQKTHSSSNVSDFIDSDTRCKNGLRTSMDFKRGLLTQVDEYDGHPESSKKLSSIKYDYIIGEDETAPYIPSGIFTHIKESITFSDGGTFPLTNVASESAIGRYRLIPYTKYKSAETRTEYVENDSLVLKTTFYPEANASDAGQYCYNSKLGSSRPKRIVITDVKTGETETIYYEYFRDKIYSEIKSKNGVITNAILNEFYKDEIYNNGLLKSTSIGLIDKNNQPENTHINRKQLIYKPKKEYEYNWNGQIVQIKTNGTNATSYLWDENLLLAEFVNLSIETLLSKNFSNIDSAISFYKNQGDIHISRFYYNEKLDKVSRIVDLNGLSTYYVYDEFGRLVYVLDNDKHVLKHYKYNYKQNNYPAWEYDF